MTLFVARHAHAGDRSAWTKDDRLRPLSERGEAEARSIAEHLVGAAPARILSSPALRCVQTVSPLAEKLGHEVVADARLFEGAGPDEVASLLTELDGDTTLLCSHGDVIPMLLQHLVNQGMRPERDLIWPKASVWAIERVDGRWGPGRYLAPPG